MSQRDYLLSFGNAGDFGRFRSEMPLPCRRGDKLVVRSSRGQELAVVIRLATEQHATFLAQSFVGEILRPATEGDLAQSVRMRRKSETLFGDARQFAGELNLPFEILDAEILLDGRQAVLYYLRSGECDPRGLLDRVSQRYHVLVTLHDLALPREQAEPTEQAGCGTGGCQSGAGGCGSCSSGGCSSCGHAHAPASTPEPAEPRVSLFSGQASS